MSKQLGRKVVRILGSQGISEAEEENQSVYPICWLGEIFEVQDSETARSFKFVLTGGHVACKTNQNLFNGLRKCRCTSHGQGLIPASLMSLDDYSLNLRQVLFDRAIT